MSSHSPAKPSSKLLAALNDARILVVGDVMLDRYWFGEVERISPEAPVPVVKVERVEERPGGAANVARNVASLGAKVSLLSVVGADEAGTCLGSLMNEAGIDAELHVDPAVSTTVKLRVLGRQQQLLRIDFETMPSHEVLRAKLAEFERRLPDFEVVILSDYGKGGLTHIAEMIRLARAAGKRVLVDPKGDDYARYRGANVLTPNRSELRQVVGRWRDDAELAEKANALRSSLGLEALLVTRSEEGMSLYHDGPAVHQPALAREVFDVSGAGDTVIATLAAMLAVGADWAEAVSVANLAAGIVVGKLGTATVSREELAAALDQA
jgi:rfaE bifunctional protein kinase chain/domain